MKRHETPKEVASVLARWAPRKISSFLDPAVGNGALLKPLVSKLQRDKSRIVCVDTDPVALEFVKENYKQSFGRSITFVNKNFLETRFSNGHRTKNGLKFDCIIMNPPFSGRKSCQERIMLPSGVEGADPVTKKLPLEGAFLVRAIQLLKFGGRVLAILPSSIVASSTGKWLREYLLENGRICCVHELPAFTFKKVEARIYLFVFEKGVPEKPVILRNHKLVRPDQLILRKSMLGDEKRFDYGFQLASIWYQKLQLRTPEAGWALLSRYAELTRGDAKSPEGTQVAIHTTDYDNGFWSLDRLKDKRIDLASKFTLKSSDLLVVRVGRRMTDSIGAVVGSASLGWTDCVIRIRVKRARLRTQLLFALRCVLACEDGKAFLERGCSAKYIVKSDLDRLHVPWELASMYPRIFAKYQMAVRKRHFEQMLSLEKFVQSMLRRRLGSVC